MKYLTKEELMDITNELLENPTRETLKILSDKYNDELKEENTVIQNLNEVSEVNVEPIPSSLPVEENNNLLEKNEIESPVVTLPIDTQNTEIHQVEQLNTNLTNFELPKLETPTFINQNNESVNFNGNVFDTPVPNVGNLMQTTDNFNSIPNTMPTTEIPITPTPFFSAQQELANNPIPVGGPVNNMVNQSPSMFGQFEQNYS